MNICSIIKMRKGVRITLQCRHTALRRILRWQSQTKGANDELHYFIRKMYRSVAMPAFGTADSQRRNERNQADG